jgi:hypothetical protein
VSQHRDRTGFADIYEKRLETAAGIALPPPSIAITAVCWKIPAWTLVIIATPQHLHAQQFCDAIAGKHVYLEKAMALTVRKPSRCAAV